MPPDTGSGQEAHSEAIRSDDPVDSLKLTVKEALEDERSDSVVKRFSENHRITGSRQPETSQEDGSEDTDSPDPAADPPSIIGAQQPLLIEPGVNYSEKTDGLHNFPDLVPTIDRKRSK